MTLNFEEEGSQTLPLACDKLAAEAVEAALDHIGCPYEAEVSLLLTTEEEIRRLNREFRGVDRATDVLSFPVTDYARAGDFRFLEERDDCFHPETGELLLGDIVIAKERVISQAEEYGHSLKREYAFLIVHSVLHLTGFDHMEEADRIEMERMQREIMEKLNILR